MIGKFASSPTRLAQPAPPTRSRPRSQGTRRAGKVLAAGLCTAAALAILVLITGSFDEVDARVLASEFGLVLGTLGGLAGSVVLQSKGPRRRLGQVTIAVASLALALAAVLIWVPGALDSDFLDRSLVITSAAMLACAHASLMYSRRRCEDSSMIRAMTRIAVGSTSSAALLTGCLMVFATRDPGGGVWRSLGVLVVIAVLTTLLAPLARRIGR